MIGHSEASPFRLVACDPSGAPSEDLGELPPVIRETCAATADHYGRVGFVKPWVGYFAVQGDVIVGGGAFVAPPTEGQVEIAYFTLPEFQGRGMAQRTARELVRLARAADPSIRLFAKTLPEFNASTTILARLGFLQAGTVTDHEIGEAWAWELDPPSE
jgi:ribosomal-protein-alanine N-acetyltransferase